MKENNRKRLRIIHLEQGPLWPLNSKAQAIPPLFQYYGELHECKINHLYERIV